MGVLSRIDLKVFPIINNGILLAMALSFYYFLIPLHYVFLSFFAGIATELICFHLSSRYTDSKWYHRILSPVTTTLSILLIVRSFENWIYPAVVVLSIVSKYVLYSERHGHIFNPGNFGIVVALCMAPAGWIGMYPNQFSLDTYPIFQTLTLGILTVGIGRRWLVSFSYLALIFVLGGLFHLLQFTHFLDIVGPELGVSSLILTFFMITDPRTSPSVPIFQIFFGCSVALLNVLFKMHEVMASPFLALFLVCPAYFLVKTIEWPALFPRSKSA
jgi:Na+-translocating ferredoxin:NAD+ oxidoreductase RnfD subunit